MVYKQFVTKGLVTGGDYNSKQVKSPSTIFILTKANFTYQITKRNILKSSIVGPCINLSFQFFDDQYYSKLMYS